MYIGIDIGGTKCAVCKGQVVKDNVLEIIDKDKFPTPHRAPGITLEKICDIIDRFTQGEKITAIGISCGGPLDCERGIVLSPPNLPGWDDIRIVDFFKQRYNCHVNLQNDANACALAEWKYGAGQGLSSLIFLTFGTGLGAGLILNGQLYEGANGNAGEVGHLRLSPNGPVGYGKKGSFEGFCSGGGIAELGRRMGLQEFKKGNPVSFCKGITDIENINAKAIAEAAESGDELAKKIYALSGKRLGQGLSLLIDILNPEAIIIGGIFSRSKELLWASCEKVLKKEVLKPSLEAVKILPAALGESIGDYGALATAIYNNRVEKGSKNYE